VDAEVARRVVGRGHDPALVRIAADDHRLAAEARAIPFFDGGVKRIHVDVQDHLASVMQRWKRVMLEAHRITTAN
jgi:hypothetical protein